MPRRSRSRSRRNRNRSRNTRAARGLLQMIPVVGPILEPLIHSLTQPSKKSRSRGRTRGRGSAGGRSGVNMPAAFAAHSQSRYSVRSGGPSTVVVSGRDLVYAVKPLDGQDRAEASLMMVIPSNPAYWTGTRVAALASAYANYRPIRFSADYVPQVSVNEPGTVIMGTLWNTTTNVEDLQQTLITSNGGCMTQCYVPATSRVQLGSELPQNLFYMKGDFGPDTCPFYFTALNTTVNVPGYFFIDYEYELKNPLGSAWSYHADQAVSVPDVPDHIYGEQVSAVLLNQDGPLGPGTVLVWGGDGWLYDDNFVDLTASSYVSLFQCNDDSTAVVPIEVDIDPTQLQVAFFPGKDLAFTPESAPQTVMAIRTEFNSAASTSPERVITLDTWTSTVDTGVDHLTTVFPTTFEGQASFSEGKLSFSYVPKSTASKRMFGFSYIPAELTTDGRNYVLLFSPSVQATAVGVPETFTYSAAAVTTLLKEPTAQLYTFAFLNSPSASFIPVDQNPVASIYVGEAPYYYDAAVETFKPESSRPQVTYAYQPYFWAGSAVTVVHLSPSSDSLILGFRPGFRRTRAVRVSTSLARFQRTLSFGRRV